VVPGNPLGIQNISGLLYNPREPKALGGGLPQRRSTQGARLAARLLQQPPTPGCPLTGRSHIDFPVPDRRFQNLSANLEHRLAWGCMHYQIDLDPKNSVIRLTITEKIMTLECAEDCYQRLSRFTSRGGPYAAIYDLSATKDTTMATEMVRSFARRRPSIPTGRPHVVVGKFPAIYGLARIFQMLWGVHR